jgi:hypothetical protein
LGDSLGVDGIKQCRRVAQLPEADLTSGQSVSRPPVSPALGPNAWRAASYDLRALSEPST